jgi:hypothetical protein
MYWEDPFNVVWMEFGFAAVAAMLVFTAVMSVLYCPRGSSRNAL